MEGSGMHESDGVSEPEETPAVAEKQWYVVRVQSGRENKVRDALLRRVKSKGLEGVIASVLVPTEAISEIRGGRKRVTQRKIYPGYLMIEMVLNDDTWFLIRETPGIGDFAGAGGIDRREVPPPTPMADHEVSRILGEMKDQEERPKLKIDFRPGDTVKIKEGPFENFDGVVEEVLPDKGLVKVIVTIFGRATEVELEYWQVEAM